MLYDMMTRKWTEIASGRFNNPVWSKNGGYIYYQSLADAGRPIRRIPIPSARIERVADFSNLQPGTTVRFWGVTADDLPIASFHFSMGRRLRGRLEKPLALQLFEQLPHRRESRIQTRRFSSIGIAASLCPDLNSATAKFSRTSSSPEFCESAMVHNLIASP